MHCVLSIANSNVQFVSLKLSSTVSTCSSIALVANTSTPYSCYEFSGRLSTDICILLKCMELVEHPPHPLCIQLTTPSHITQIQYFILSYFHQTFLGAMLSRMQSWTLVNVTLFALGSPIRRVRGLRIVRVERTYDRLALVGGRPY